MTTVIPINGHLKTDDWKTSLERLVEIIDSHPLNRAYEKIGGFIEHDARNLRKEWLEGVENAVSFFGNFADISHVFHVVSNDAPVVERLTAAIAANRLTPAYLRQPPPYYAEKLVIARRRISETRGEVLLSYDGRPIEQCADWIRPDGSGGRDGSDDSHWHDVARNVLERRHLEDFDRGLIPASPDRSA